MQTSDEDTALLRDSEGGPVRPLRLRMAKDAGRNALDGGWWPYSRDLAAELGDLVEWMPPEHGRIVGALYSPPDWDPSPRQIPLRNGIIRVGSLPRDDTHVILLTLRDRRVLTIAVVPPGFSPDQGEEALLAAATARNAHSATELFREVLDQPEVDPRDRWTRYGPARP